ncbi:hypothetical protein [Brevundimonas vesicularis]|uniref:Uncharacterized protein n=1 Tax=Brevundimonas vesicularis TaxID=41276 RepID=A0ABU4KL83_BREVE|nr:hypothetical protein [Brevundimonas vesicularis]MDX2333741.1 hypothetical protein [Brevundimonas vesicularis]
MKLKATYKPEEKSYDTLDAYLFFFLCFFSLRDWLEAYTPEAFALWKARFEGTLEWRICRDVANSFKHLKLTQSSLDAPLKLIREFHADDAHRVSIIAEGRIIPLSEIANKLWSECCNFVREAEPLLPPRGRGVSDELSG